MMTHFLFLPPSNPPPISESFLFPIYIYIYTVVNTGKLMNATEAKMQSHHFHLTHTDHSLFWGGGGGSFVFFLMPKNILSSFIIMANDPGLQFTLPLTCKLSRKLKKGTQQNLHRFTCRPYQH